MADQAQAITDKHGKIIGYKGSKAGQASGPAEDRTYRDQIGVGDQGAYKAFRGAETDSEDSAKRYLESKKKKMSPPPEGGAPGLSSLAKK